MNETYYKSNIPVNNLCNTSSGYNSGYMQTFGERVRDRRKELGLNQSQVAKLAGLEQPTISHIETGRNASSTEILALAKALDCYPAWLKNGTPPKTSNQHVLNEPGGSYGPSDDLEAVPMPEGLAKGIPVVGTVRGGQDGYYAELEHAVGQGEGFIRYPTRDPNTYALRVKGDSMRPRIRPGEFIVVSPNSQPIVGDEAVIKTRDGRVMVKLYAAPRNGQIEFHSINHDHKPITLDTSEIEYIHHVLIIAKADTYYPSMGL